MPTIPQFDPPANVADFSDVQRKNWNQVLSSWFNNEIDATGGTQGPGRSQFYNPTVESTDEPSLTEVQGSIKWQGFPKSLEVEGQENTDAVWKAAEGPANRIKLQDEYLEWRTEGPPERITRVTFTCEPPEYWESLAEGYPTDYQGPRNTPSGGDHQKVLALYQQLVSPKVQLAELLKNGVYNPFNKWNTTDGIVHLTQGANTLGAEIDLAAKATILRNHADGTPVTDGEELVNCSPGFGTNTRASDPHIAQVVNGLAIQGYSLTLRNPVGLYIDSLNTTGWTKPGPGGKGIPTGSEFWRIIRGHDTYGLRAVYEVPAGVLRPDGQQMTVSDIKIGGIPIQYGGQIAKMILMKLVATGCRQGQSHRQSTLCEQRAAVHAAAVSTIKSRRASR
jgi:hypothetical protein